jgi:hypothetical protein
LNVLLPGLNRFVLASVIDGNANGSGEFGRNAGSLKNQKVQMILSEIKKSPEISYLYFGQSKATSRTDSGVVPLGWTTNDWSQWSSSGTREEFFRFLDTVLATTEFTSRLVEPGAYMTLPPFVVMGIRYDMISSHHFSSLSRFWLPVSR